MRSALDPSSLLLSGRALAVTHEPFCFFSADDYLPPDLYEELHASWPGGANYSANQDGKLGFRSSEDPQAFLRWCADQPAWSALLGFFGSDAFAADLQHTFAAPLARARGPLGRKRWLNTTGGPAPNNPLLYALREPMRTTFQFSELPDGASVEPHTDAKRKLVSLLLYFRDADWRDEYGGGTEFYEPIDAARARSWATNSLVPFGELKPVGHTGFAGNRLVGFVRSERSFHGVQPIRCPAGAGRKALLINLKRLGWTKRHEP